MMWRRHPDRAAACPPGTRVYAIGDVHGCLAELETLLQLIAEHSAPYTGTTHLIFLGDYVDRGPHSAGVLKRVLQPLPCVHQHFLLGNHDQAMLDCWESGAGLHSWLAHGGAQTLHSYGIAITEQIGSCEHILRVMHDRIPAQHIAFLRSLTPSCKLGDYFFAHAGIRPGVALARQAAADLRWIRGEFLESKAHHGAVVVHGHTICAQPEFLPNRIGVDTGCYRTGLLTALVLEGTHRSLLQTPQLSRRTMHT